MNCLVWEGLSNRINALVTSYLATPANHTIDLTWAVNRHCPVRFEDVFLPLERVNVRNVYASRFAYSLDWDRVCWFYAARINPASDDAAQMRMLYRYLISRLKIRHPKPPQPHRAVGIHFRAHFQHGRQPLKEFLPRVLPWLGDKDPRRVYVFSDSAFHQQAIADHVRAAGYRVIDQTRGHTKTDLDRSPEKVRAFMSVLRQLASCQAGVLSNSYRSTVTDSCRGFGVAVDYTYTQAACHRDDHLESQLGSNLR